MRSLEVWSSKLALSRWSPAWYWRGIRTGEFPHLLAEAVISYWRRDRPEPFKHIHFPSSADVALRATVGDDGGTVTLESDRPVKGVVLDAEGDWVKWDDQAIDLVPGDPQVVFGKGLAGREVKVRYLGDGSA